MRVQTCCRKSASWLTTTVARRCVRRRFPPPPDRCVRGPGCWSVRRAAPDRRRRRGRSTGRAIDIRRRTGGRCARPVSRPDAVAVARFPPPCSAADRGRTTALPRPLRALRQMAQTQAWRPLQLAGVNLRATGQDIQQRRFADAVRPVQADHLAALQREAARRGDRMRVAGDQMIQRQQWRESLTWRWPGRPPRCRSTGSKPPRQHPWPAPAAPRRFSSRAWTPAVAAPAPVDRRDAG
jgi:hypothetical protein